MYIVQQITLGVEEVWQVTCLQVIIWTYQY